MVLRRADVVNGALDLLAVEGLDGLTMRKLGAALSVQGGALYRHFPSKEALLDAMAERLLAGVAGPLPDAPWPEQLQILGERLRSVLLTHRDGARVVAGTYVTGPNTMAAGAQAVEILCAAGFAPQEAAWIAFAAFYYVLGHTIEEQGMAQLGAADDWAARLRAVRPTTPEPLAGAMRSLAEADPGERFRYGLRVFIGGVVRELEQASAVAAGRDGP